ncbi:carotenoid oxygenase family protein [Spongiactinospora sp. TRM90649]|uniref:carotenoid oxygenase family protein n=1 Tax=Spongiactinospora sp. TRM90649 TaxID=3031114 RepID=UPI0023F70C3C|nr:carotenoid oxygenase family protein [Spongiactinospora sp. TRM90649]MDF5758022.1 carotenoid oxygenase family protein [Spongiactinospora sp. TRM90649]
MKYLEGAFAPVTEEVTAHDLPVTGRIPDALNGRYLRNGPNTMGVEDPVVHVWGMGQGMVHGVRLRDGHAEWYRNRFVRVPGFAPMVHVIRHARRTIAMAEGGLPPAELDEELNTWACARWARPPRVSRRGRTPSTTRAPASCTRWRTCPAGASSSTS